jgi:hypothetical protein
LENSLFLCPFSIAMLVYQRVVPELFEGKLTRNLDIGGIDQ